MSKQFSTIEEALIALKKGHMVILVDDEDRENEGGLVLAADFVSEQAIAFMSQFGRGLICLSMTAEMIDRLRLPMMTASNQSSYGTAFTGSIDAATGVTTGSSAADRTRTIQVAIDSSSAPHDLMCPGHVFPRKAKEGGVLVRKGQTEGSVDLMRIAGMTPAAVMCEIINDDGKICRQAELLAFAQRHQLPIISVQALLDYRIRNENLLAVAATSRIPLKRYGNFTMTVFNNRLDDKEHFALIKPSLPEAIPLVRIHSECITGDIFGSSKCDCGSQLDESLAIISTHGGILIYLRQEGRGIGLANKLKAYALQDKGYDTVDANVQLGLPVDARDYAIAYQILKHLGIHEIKLLTNNPNKVNAIQHYGIRVSERVSLATLPTKENSGYLRTKQEKMGHLLLIE